MRYGDRQAHKLYDPDCRIRSSVDDLSEPDNRKLAGSLIFRSSAEWLVVADYLMGTGDPTERIVSVHID